METVERRTLMRGGAINAAFNICSCLNRQGAVHVVVEARLALVGPRPVRIVLTAYPGPGRVPHALEAKGKATWI
jgi:hypothetical protein